MIERMLRHAAKSRYATHPFAQTEKTQLKMHSHRRDDGLACEAIPAIGILPGELSGCGRGCAAVDIIFRSKPELVGDVEVERLALKPDAKAEKIPVQVGGQGRVIGIRHRVLIKNIAATHMPAVFKIPRHTKLIHPAALPPQVDRNVLMKWALHRRLRLLDGDR